MRDLTRAGLWSAEGAARARVAGKWVAVALLLAVACRLTLAQSQNAILRHERARDFRANIWQPGRDVLAGRNPYPSPSSPAVKGAVPGYPPLTFLAFLPLAALPFVPAAYVWAALMIAVSLGAIAAVGVRDPICYALVLLSMPVVGSVWWGNPTPLVVFGAALAWRWRERAWLGPTAVAAAFAIKFVTWPLFVWLLLSGRPRSALRAAPLALGMVVVPWAVIAFRGARQYPALLNAISDVGARKGSFVQAAALRGGMSSLAALALGLTVAAVLMGLAAALGGDYRTYSLALIAGLASSPIVWIFYFGVIAVIVGIAKPRFSRPWLLVPALWVGHMMYFPPSAVMLTETILVVTITVAWLARFKPTASSELARAG